MWLAIADRVRRWAVVGALDDNGLALRCELPALSTAWGQPVSSTEGLRNCGTSVEESTVRIAGWGLEEGVGVAVDLLAGAAIATSACATAAVPVAGGRGPAGVGLVSDEGE